MLSLNTDILGIHAYCVRKMVVIVLLNKCSVTQYSGVTYWNLLGRIFFFVTGSRIMNKI